MVLFTLTGLNVDVGLYEFIEYPTYDFPDISASYYLDLSFNPIFFDNVFYFKTTNPDMLDFTGVNITKTNRTAGEIRPDFGQIKFDNEPMILDFEQDIEIRAIYKFDDAPEHFARFLKLGWEIEGHHTDINLRNTIEIFSNVDHTTWTFKIVIHGITLFEETLSTSFNSRNTDKYNYFILKYSNFGHKMSVFLIDEDSWLSNGNNDNQRWSSLLNSVDRLDFNIQVSKINEIFGSYPNKKVSFYYGAPYNRAGFAGPPGAAPDYIDLTLNIINTYTNFDGDMNFKCESSYWPDISFSEGVISNYERADINNYLPPPSAGGVHYNKNIGVQWLARNITGGYNNSDLFANEEALVQQYVTLNGPPPTGATTFYTTAIRNSYRYYRLIIPSTNSDIPKSQVHTAWDHRVGIRYIKVYNNGSISNITDISASTEFIGVANAHAWVAENVNSSTNGFSWLSGVGGDYNKNTGNYEGSSTTETNTINLSGEWIQWRHDEEIKISKFVLYTGGEQLIGLPPSRIVLAGRNNENDNWNILSYKTYPFEFAEHSIIFEDSIKTLITNTLDVSGGSDAAPLSNADNGRNNVSREALLHLLDNDVSANVQRVHNMIAKAQTNVDSDGNDISFGDTSNLWIPIEFFDGDTIKFKLIYKPDQITDSSGVAIDDSGNALGTNKIEDQDYVVRLNIVGNRSDLFIRSSFLSNDISVNNFSGTELVDHIASRNSSNSIINDSNLYLDNNFGSYVKVGNDPSYNFYKWSTSFWVKGYSNNNWIYSTIGENATTGTNIYFTWI